MFKKTMKNLSIFLILLACSSSMIAQKNRFADNLESTKVTIERLKKSIPQYLKKSDVPGMTIALVRDGKLVWTGSFGVKNSKYAVILNEVKNPGLIGLN